MTEDLNMPTKYQPTDVEKGRYEKWVENGYFKPSENPDAEPYSIVIPPPNVTGKLHLGHAWDATLQDIIIRQKRMQGYDTLWLPGMDHAGIATQAKVEQKLRETGVSRYDLGRDKFLEEVWSWKEEYAENIRNQWAKLGISVDYSRERFTLDEGLSQAVRKVFVDLYEKGLIYQGEYIINWDPQAQTALSDIEVEHEEIEGAFYHMKYPLSDGSGYLEVATTRPETMLGDTAVAVNPDDERYQEYIGKTVILPLVNREMPIVADDYVDMEFGTGVVKITPAHDPNDFEIGNRHQLERINVMHDDGSMNELAGIYEGMDRFEARKAIVSDLKEQDFLIKIEKMVHSVGHSERTGVVVEPRLSKQWFVKMDPLAKRTLENQENEETKIHFVPDRFEKGFIHWMDNLHDWCISRQLWWGHQIPAWYHKETGEIYVGMEAPEDEENWKQDEDVLDTWFSSALWPFSTMGWPEESEDFKRYYPTNTLVTGYDIIKFWVSRMIFQGLEFTDERPFKHALIHGLIRDEQGRKMSKSLGNGVDPNEVIEKYGVDALRWFLSNGSAPGQDVRFSYEKMDAAWNFINKIWNASRYVLMNLGEFSIEELDLSGEKTIADKWILARLNETIRHVTAQLDKFEFGEAGRALYKFIWDDFCDWYIEMSKEILSEGSEKELVTTKSILTHVLDQILRLLHPIMPFVTEEIWENIPHQGDSLVIAEFPKANETYDDAEAIQNMNLLIELIRSVRNIRSEVNRPLSKPIDLLIKANSDKEKEFLIENKSFIERFCNPGECQIDTSLDIPDEVKSAVVTGAELYLPLAGLVDFNEEIARLEKELEKWQSEIKRVDSKLANEKFVQNAPEAVVAKEREKGKEYQERYDAVSEQLEKLKKLQGDA